MHVHRKMRFVETQRLLSRLHLKCLRLETVRNSWQQVCEKCLSGLTNCIIKQRTNRRHVNTLSVSPAWVCCTAPLCRCDIHCVGLLVFAMAGKRSLNLANPPCAALTSWSEMSLRNTGLTWPTNATPEPQTGSDSDVANEPEGSGWGAKIKIPAAE